VVAPRARTARRPQGRARGEPAPRRAVAAGGEARPARRARPGHRSTRGAGVDHPPAGSPPRRATSDAAGRAPGGRAGTTCAGGCDASAGPA
jgi:hypothetical protein